MYQKMITSFILITTYLPTLNASDISQEEPPRVNPKHGYVLKIIEKLKDVQPIANLPDVKSFGIHLQKANGSLKQGWVAVLINVDEKRRLEGEPVRSFVGRERALFSLPDEYSRIGDGVIVCQDGLKVGQIVSCKILLCVPIEQSQENQSSEPDHFFLAHRVAHKK